jgi:hypothetical protein
MALFVAGLIALFFLVNYQFQWRYEIIKERVPRKRIAGKVLRIGLLVAALVAVTHGHGLSW